MQSDLLQLGNYLENLLFQQHDKLREDKEIVLFLQTVLSVFLGCSFFPHMIPLLVPHWHI